MNLQEFESFLINQNIPYESDVELKKKTWIHRGGKADLFVTPTNIQELENVMSVIYRQDIKHLLIGCTSNLYILNSTDIPIVISTIKCNTYSIHNNVLECDCGVQVSHLAKQMISKGVKGFEYLTKLPGTVGAAICNNSTVKSPENSITSLLIDFDIITPQGVKHLTKDDLHLDFRTSDIKKRILQGVILKARMQITSGNALELEEIARKNETDRYRILEGPAHNLGCTVHKMHCLGPMPKRYAMPLRLYSKLLTYFVKDSIERKKYTKCFLLTISGHKRLIPYVSDKQLITFVWRDENADDYFEEYLQFMREVCKTDQVEIEIIR